MRTGYDTRGPRSGPPFDLREFRRQFQALSREDCIYLDNAATTFSCLAALDTWREAYAGGLGSPGRADHPLAREADRELAALRSRLGDRLGAGHDDDVVLTSSATEALNLLASGMEPTLRAGDLIVVSELEHHSNALPWHRLASRTGASVATLPVGEQGDLDLGIWDRLLNARPRLVAVTATSNVTGCRPDVSRLAREAHSEGARVIVDAAQALPHEPLNFEDLGCDAMVVSAHKMGAPRGVAAFVAKSSLAEELTPMLLGGGMVKDYAGADSVWSDVPERLEPGTRDLAALRAWLAAFELWHDDGGALEHERQLGGHLRRELARRPHIETLPSGTDFCPSLVSFHVAGLHPHDVSEALSRRGICIRTGHLCAQPLLRRFGHASVNRVSLARYTSAREVEAFLEALDLLS